MSALDEITDAARLRRAFGTFATGVTVMTVGGAFPHGMTANSFASVSLDPPLVLVCVARDAVMHARLGASACFGISVLAAHQETVARHFASRRRGTGPAEFDGVPWLAGPLTGVPLIAGALSCYECELWRTFDGGDHTIVTGRLLALSRQDAGDALVFYNGRFHQLGQRFTEVRA